MLALGSTTNDPRISQLYNNHLTSLPKNMFQFTTLLQELYGYETIPITDLIDQYRSHYKKPRRKYDHSLAFRHLCTAH